jgi:hypothetical protein
MNVASAARVIDPTAARMVLVASSGVLFAARRKGGRGGAMAESRPVLMTCSIDKRVFT